MEITQTVVGGVHQTVYFDTDTAAQHVETCLSLLRFSRALKKPPYIKLVFVSPRHQVGSQSRPPPHFRLIKSAGRVK